MIQRFICAIAEISGNGSHLPFPFTSPNSRNKKAIELEGDNVEPFPPFPSESSQGPRSERGMIGNSSKQYFFIRASILWLQSIPPLCIVWTAGRLLGYFPRILSILDAIALIETCFFFLVYLPIRAFYQRPAQHPTLYDRDERQRLFKRVLDTVTDGDKFLSEWFQGANVDDIKADNVKEYLAWAFFNCHLHEVTDPDHQEELDGYIRMVETHPASKGRKFEPGRAPVTGMRLTLDPVKMKHRPFCWYMILFLLDTLTFFQFLSLGFTFHHPASIPKVFPPRPHAYHKATKQSASPVLSYYIKPHTSKTRLPIVLLHGIGVGLNTYLPLVTALNKHSPPEDQVGILAIEILQVSFRLTSKIATHDVLAAEIRNIMLASNMSRAVLVSHSYGSIITSHLLKSPATPKGMFAAAVLIDPVSILVHHASVAYNFVYRPPRTAAQWQLHYFAGTDPGVARTLSRSFFWAQNVLWKEDLQGIEASVVLGGRDLIVDTASVAQYMSDGEFSGENSDLVIWDSKGDEVKIGGAREGVRGRAGEKGEDVRVLWFNKADHANVVDMGRYRREVVREILWRCERGVKA